LLWCRPAVPAVQLASSWSVRIFGTLTRFHLFGQKDVTRGLVGRVRGWGAAAMLFWVKNCWTESLVVWCIVVIQKPALCTPFVWVFSFDIFPPATEDIVNRMLSALVDESTDIFHIFISPTSHGRHKF
jgi:hypothetical protein